MSWLPAQRTWRLSGAYRIPACQASNCIIRVVLVIAIMLATRIVIAIPERSGANAVLLAVEADLGLLGPSAPMWTGAGVQVEDQRVRRSLVRNSTLLLLFLLLVLLLLLHLSRFSMFTICARLCVVSKELYKASMEVQHERKLDSLDLQLLWGLRDLGCKG